MSFDISKYLEKKERGLINKVQKTNLTEEGALTYAIFEKKYEPDITQTPPVYVQVADEVTGITKKELDDRKDELQKEIDGLTQFETDAIE